MSQNVVVLNSDSVLFSGNGVITHANHLDNKHFVWKKFL